MSSGLEDSSLFDLFRMEAEEQVRVLQQDLMLLETEGTTASRLQNLMRASHSIKGAARIVGLDAIVQLTHGMEDRFVAAQAGRTLVSADIDRMLAATDWLAKLQSLAEADIGHWLEENSSGIEKCAAALREATEAQPAADLRTPSVEPPPEAAEAATSALNRKTEASDTAIGDGSPPAATFAPPKAEVEREKSTPSDIFAPSSKEERGRERTVRLTSDRFDQLLSLSAETLVSARQLATWGDVLDRTHRIIGKTQQMVEDAPADAAPQSATARKALQGELERQLAILAIQISEFNEVSRANERTAERLYRSVLGGRLRPFSEGIAGLSRLVRDVTRELGKSVKLEIAGEGTRVDRDILERLEAPMSHLVTNAIDHGIETPAERLAAGKQGDAHIRIHARHENGRLVITVRDEGRGIDPEQVRRRVIKRGLAAPETVAGLTEQELLEFLFLPGFSTRDTTSLLSGRGVGLDVVQKMAHESGGSVTVTTIPGTGTTFRLTLPVTRSVIRVIRVLAAGELFSIPMVRIDHVDHVQTRDDADKPVATWNGTDYPVLSLGTMLGLSDEALPRGPLPLLFSGGFAFAVDRLVDQAELSVRRLDARLGKIPGVSAASLDENGNPLLILDMDDLIQTAAGRPRETAASASDSLAGHILVVDDSHTVREMERRLLARSGYRVSTAQNGQEAWNLLRLNDYDLLISDVDMPQMNGIELITRVRANPRLGRIPVIILSYKDREEDRRRGLDAGADFYLTKGSFDNGGFLQAVVDLIGEATPATGEQG
jgi:two-component system sensor histidine kinase and response regulator WspE